MGGLPGRCLAQLHATCGCEMVVVVGWVGLSGAVPQLLGPSLLAQSQVLLGGSVWADASSAMVGAGQAWNHNLNTLISQHTKAHVHSHAHTLLTLPTPTFTPAGGGGHRAAPGGKHPGGRVVPFPRGGLHQGGWVGVVV